MSACYFEPGNHSEGVNVASCDGSVRFVKDSDRFVAARQLWLGLATRATRPNSLYRLRRGQARCVAGLRHSNGIKIIPADAL